MDAKSILFAVVVLLSGSALYHIKYMALVSVVYSNLDCHGLAICHLSKFPEVSEHQCSHL